ncbi:hypothetical protein QJS10_CPB13g00578 [Acorus calamus]|uniref:Eukaryotic translation initiation factor 3 30 kDa subunit n=1 Tax=Acorus calamus TaxID=4465 RepID=A0AAV9DGH6_ACOCL|nr:hypothetical protein QJS10_CPB13g00578 [Acorus calamus]
MSVVTCFTIKFRDSGQSRLVEEVVYKSTTELFAKKGDEKTLDNFIPKSESDFMEYVELISHKLHPYEKSFHYIGLLKVVMRLSTTALKAADAKEGANQTRTKNKKQNIAWHGEQHEHGPSLNRQAQEPNHELGPIGQRRDRAPLPAKRVGMTGPDVSE